MANPDLNAALVSDQQQAAVSLNVGTEGPQRVPSNPIGYVRPQPAGLVATTDGLLVVGTG